MQTDHLAEAQEAVEAAMRAVEKTLEVTPIGRKRGVLGGVLGRLKTVQSIIRITR